MVSHCWDLGKGKKLNEVKPSFFNSPSSSGLTVSFICMEGMSMYVTADEVILPYIF